MLLQHNQMILFPFTTFFPKKTPLQFHNFARYLFLTFKRKIISISYAILSAVFLKVKAAQLLFSLDAWLGENGREHVATRKKTFSNSRNYLFYFNLHLRRELI